MHSGKPFWRIASLLCRTERGQPGCRTTITRSLQPHLSEVSMKTVIAGALGECVHVAGVMNFLRLAEAAGWRTVFLGPAVSIEQMLRAAEEEQADLVGVSYRLTPETGERLLGEF